MALVSEVIRDAWEATGALRPGQNVTGQQLDDGLKHVQAMFDGWAAGGMLGQLTEVSVTADYTANEWERVSAPAEITITIPDTIDDTRAPYDLAMIAVAQGSPDSIYLFDAKSSAWTAISSLSLSDVCPLADRDRMGFAALLAERLGPIAPHNQKLATGFRLKIAMHTGSQRAPTAPDYY